MACTAPLHGYYSKTVNPTGKRSLSFSIRDGYWDKPVTVPCGTCLGCRLDKAHEWAARCLHESKLYTDNAFVTLTYDDSNVPWRSGAMTLEPRDVTLFLKRLRKSRGDMKLRYFQCGEYGETTARPHHHMLVFNCRFPDRVRCGNSKSGAPQYVSTELDKLWGFGKCWIGDVTYESAGYIARYAMKKAVQKSVIADGREPEYQTMSRKPGLGSGWARSYMKDYLRLDSIVVEGREVKIPRYYETLAKRDGLSLARVKLHRRMHGVRIRARNSELGIKLFAKAAVLESRIRLLKRELE